MARQHGHPPVTFLGKGGSWIQNTLAPPCGSRWRCHGRVRLVLIFFLLIPFLFKQWWSGSGGPGRSQRVTTPHCSCGTTQTSRAWGAPPTDSVLEPELDTPQSQVKGGWLLLVCHFLDALQTFRNTKRGGCLAPCHFKRHDRTLQIWLRHPFALSDLRCPGLRQRSAEQRCAVLHSGSFVPQSSSMLY